MSTEVLATIAAGISAVAALAALWIAFIQATEARRTRDVGALLPLYQAHQSTEAVAIRRIIRERKDELESLADPERLMLRNYINQLNFMANLILDKLVDEDKAQLVFRDAMTNCFTSCKEPIIQKIRAEPEKKESFASGLQVVAEAWIRGEKVPKRQRSLFRPEDE